MGKTLVKNRRLNYLALLFLVLMSALILAACGSTNGATGSADNPQDQRDDQKNPTILPNYEINGSGVITEVGDNFGTSLKVYSVTSTGGEFYFNDMLGRLDFKGTSINSISVNNNTATIMAGGSIQEVNGTFTGGYSFELSITDGDQDTFSIKITDPDGIEIYNLGPQPIDMLNGNFTITKL